MTERRANTRYLVGGNLLTLSATAEDDAAFGAAADDGSADRHADRRVVHGLFAVGAVVVDRVTETPKRLLQVLLEREARVIGADRDVHWRDCTMRACSNGVARLFTARLQRVSNR